MPVFTVYAKIIRSGKKTHKVKNTPVHNIYQEIMDWSDLKENLLITARWIFHDHHQTTTDVSLERHLPGKGKRATTGYRTTKIRYNRQPEVKARITYNPKQDTVKAEKVAFITPEAYGKFKLDYDFERGKKWEIPKAVPPGFEASLDNPQMLFFDNLRLKTPTYLREGKDSYGSRQNRSHAHGMYAVSAHGSYAGRNYGTIEQDKQDRANQF